LVSISGIYIYTCHIGTSQKSGTSWYLCSEVDTRPTLGNPAEVYFPLWEAFFLPTYCKGKNNLNVKKKRLLSGWLLFLSLYVSFTNVLTLFLLSSRVALIPVCQQTPQALLHSTVAATKLLEGAEAHEEQRRSASKGSRTTTTTRAREQTKDFVLLQGNYGRCL